MLKTANACWTHVRTSTPTGSCGWTPTSLLSGWRLHDLRRTIVSGMARLGIPPHVADKILNHQAGTISGVAAVYQRHLAERKEALDRWGGHGGEIVQAEVRAADS